MLLFLSNLLIFNLNLSQLLSILSGKLLDNCVLRLQLHFFVLDVTTKCLNFAVEIGQFILCKLQFSFRFQTHFLHLSHVRLVLFVDVLDFAFSIVTHLTHRFLVVLLLLLNFEKQSLDVFVGLFNVIIMVLLFLIDLALMFLEKSRLRLLELALLFFFLQAKIVITSRILQHLLGVFVTTSFQLLMLLLFKLLDLLLKCFFHFNLGVVQMIVSVSCLHFGAG